MKSSLTWSVTPTPKIRTSASFRDATYNKVINMRTHCVGKRMHVSDLANLKLVQKLMLGITVCTQNCDVFEFFVSASLLEKPTVLLRFWFSCSVGRPSVMMMMRLLTSGRSPFASWKTVSRIITSAPSVLVLPGSTTERRVLCCVDFKLPKNDTWPIKRQTSTLFTTNC